MARRRAKGRRKSPNKRSRRGLLRKLAAWWPSVRTRRKLRRAWRLVPRPVRFTFACGALAALLLGINWTYQVVRKPSELLFPVSESFYKEPAETWQVYGALFRRHATDIMTSDLLAALAQVEGSGNPVARTYWRLDLANEPFDIFRPASSAVGMYQITDGTFAAARRYCVQRHRVVEEGPWYDWGTCWLNELYTRTVPSHAIELTSAYLDRAVRSVLTRYRLNGATLAEKQALAAAIHLCGAGAAAGYARRGFAFAPGERCGDHSARAYVGRVTGLQQRFRALAQE